MEKDNTMLKAIYKQMDRCNDILKKKFEEYGNHEDPFWHFERSAGLLGGTRELALMHLFAKHLTCIVEMAEGPDSYSGDQWEEKLTDAINYLLILSAMVDETCGEDVPERAHTDTLSPQQAIAKLARGEK